MPALLSSLQSVLQMQNVPIPLPPSSTSAVFEHERNAKRLQTIVFQFDIAQCSVPQLSAVR